MEAKFTEQQVLSELSKKKSTSKTNYNKTYKELNGVQKVGLENSEGKIVVAPIFDKIRGGDGVYKCTNGNMCYILFF